MQSVTASYRVNTKNPSQYLFLSPGTDGHPYRIPAITTLKNGNILTVAEFRWGDSDIGDGHIDLVGRISQDNDSNGETWSTPEDITDRMYALLPNTKALFVGSGKICQSRVAKVPKYYRLYAALCTLNQSNVFSTHSENFTNYSDDFGKTWKVLRSNTESCLPNSDKPKCKEQPDGSVDYYLIQPDDLSYLYDNSVKNLRPGIYIRNHQKITTH